ENMRKFNTNRQVFCSILTNCCCSEVGTIVDADTIIFYDTDLNPSMDARTQEWCDKVGRSKDIHIYRLESGNSIEEKLSKNGTKELIREVVAQGTDYSLAFLTQERLECAKRGWELQQLQKLKEEERQTMEGEEDLFTYTREDAYNMVGGH
ncbi:hypothetical protein GOODEAATRI_008755, partial [Goodea atripinnis]